MGRGKRLLWQRRCTTASQMMRHPVSATGQERQRAGFRNSTRHDHFNAATRIDANRHAPGAATVAQHRNRFSLAGTVRDHWPQRQLRGRGLAVGYAHPTMIAAPTCELIDIGVNLTHESFAHDLPEVLRRAHLAGVSRMIITGTSVASTREAIALARTDPHRLHATAGLHPHHASEFSPAVRDELRELAADPAVVAIGECGLDYYRNYSPREAQLAAFRGLLELAVETGKPVFLHQRDAHADFVAILREFRGSMTDGVAHCFTGTPAELADCLAMNLAIGITGWICDERRGLHLLPMMREIPAARLMVETDAPYLLPRTLRPKPASRRNEPACLPEVAKTVAMARGEPLEQLALSSTAAAMSLFRLG
jgi:TatD DNase family protein